MGEMRPKSDRDTVLGRSRLQGRVEGVGEEEDEEVEEEEDGDGEAELKGQGSSSGLWGPELKLQVDWVSESSSDMVQVLLFSSSKVSEVTVDRQGGHYCKTTA
ncbi:hypothetical protein AALO_G00177650 [Alosa alosa]|uniref:Uncharacterized protein n=1 Tax=Alosa alosa TaxID=278164 RepID=A0AAV6G9K6_9TELE|nr:hypothetical protein AALO_G00177650 [Alosa alosa]